MPQNSGQGNDSQRERGRVMGLAAFLESGIRKRSCLPEMMTHWRKNVLGVGFRWSCTWTFAQQ